MPRFLVGHAALACLLVACGPSYEAQSTLKGVRVIGVQKDKPYARPGETVKLSMLLHDGKDPSREVSVRWFGGCDRPPGDSYRGCFFGRSEDDGLFAGLTPIGEGLDVEYTIPADSISGRPPPPGNTTPYGMSIVFFTACTGELQPSPGDPIPIKCVDGNGDRVNADGFVAGYSQLFVYDSLVNQNPVIDGFVIRGTEFKSPGGDSPLECIGLDCVEQAKTEVGVPAENPDAPPKEPPGEPLDNPCENADGTPLCDSSDLWCIDHCEKEDIDDCPKHEIAVSMPQNEQNQEVDETSPGDRRFEQMWVNYYIDRGKLDGDIKLVQDATEGWQPDRRDTKFFAPQECGPFHIWAAAHDNRGGVEFTRVRLVAR